MTPGFPTHDADPKKDTHASRETTPLGIDAQFGLADAVSIIVGIVIGTAIFKSPTLVFQNTSSPWEALALWIAGGVVSLCGALCYAELTTTFPRDGGDYEYLTRAYGPATGFLFGWAQLTAILSGSIAAMAYAFGDYAVRFLLLDKSSAVWLAMFAVVVVSSINLLGVVVGKTVQNLLTAVKVIGLVGVGLAGLLLFDGRMPSSAPIATGTRGAGIGLAMVFVLYAYGGWNDAAFVAAEVRDRRRNLPLALVAGVAGITVIYLLINLAYVVALGFEGARQSYAPAADVMHRALGPLGSRFVSVLVMISALGAINGMTLTGSRIYATMGADHRGFSWLGRWNQDLLAPVTAMITQAAIALLMIVGVGTQRGQATIDWILTTIGLPAVPWDTYFGGFETLVACTAPIFWAFFLLTGIALVILRSKARTAPRPFRVPCYPIPVIVFCVTCIFMLYSSLSYAGWLTLLAVVPVSVGVPVYFFSTER